MKVKTLPKLFLFNILILYSYSALPFPHCATLVNRKKCIALIRLSIQGRLKKKMYLSTFLCL